jgi:sugar phosphate isomerase/epimerase
MWSESAPAAMRRLQELGLNDFDVVMAPGHFWHDELPAMRRSTLSAEFRADGIRIESLNLPALDHNLASCIPEVREFTVGLYRRTMEVGADLGVRATVVVPGRVSALFPPAQSDSEGWLAAGIEQLLRVAERLDQRLYLESHPQTPISNVDRIEAFLNRVGHERLKVAYDVSNAEFISEDQVDAIHRLAPWLGQVHLSDGTSTRWRHDRIGLGTVNFEAILQALADVGFEGVKLLEIISPTPVEDIRASIAALG